MDDRQKRALRISIVSLIILTAGMLIYETLSSSNLSDSSYSGLLYAFGKTSGQVGLFFLSVLIFSGDTARLFDRIFGMDRIIKFQRKFSYVTTLFVLLHPALFILSDSAFIAALVPSPLSLPLALGAIALYILVIVMVSSVLYKRVSYNAWQYLHVLTYVLLLSGLYHALNLGSDMDDVPQRTVFSIMTALVVLGAIYRTSYKIKEKKTKRYKVKKVRQETHDTFSIILESDKRIRFKAGQFCFLRIEKDGLHARHPFTISSPPKDRDLRFTIKQSGRFTKAASMLRRGDEVIVDGPFGIFTAPEKKSDLVFIAGGVGITPFMSMIQDNTRRKEKHRITLLYGSRTGKDVIFRRELDSLRSEALDIVHVLSMEDDPHMERGYIGKDVITKHVKDMKGKRFYICGPEKMKEKVVSALLDLGVMRHDIVIEDFFW